MIIEEIKLKLDLAMYKGKTRLRQWYPIVKGHMKEIETTQNNLADKVLEGEDKLQKTNNTLTIALEEAAAKHEEFDRKINTLSDNLVETDAALLAEISVREDADKALEGKITAEAARRERGDDALRYSSLPCYDFTKTMYDFYDSSFEVGSLVKFYGYDAGIIMLDNGSRTPSGEKSYITIEYPFKQGHTYQAIITVQGSKAEVITDNGVFVSLEAEKLAREAGDKAVEDKITAEAAERDRVDSALAENIAYAAAAIANEATAREAADADLQSDIAAEAAERARVDNVLSGNLVDIAAAITVYGNKLLDLDANFIEEKAAREEAENKINNEILNLKSSAHTHDNKDVIDDITAEDVEKLRELKNHVTQDELDAAFEHLYEIAIAHDLEHEKIYYAIGLTVYDGGLIGAHTAGKLDGGEIGDEITDTADCGDAEPYVANISASDGATIDGGTLGETSTGRVIDGGTI